MTRYQVSRCLWYFEFHCLPDCSLRSTWFLDDVVWCCSIGYVGLIQIINYIGTVIETTSHSDCWLVLSNCCQEHLTYNLSLGSDCVCLTSARLGVLTKRGQTHRKKREISGVDTQYKSHCQSAFQKRERRVWAGVQTRGYRALRPDRDTVRALWERKWVWTSVTGKGCLVPCAVCK